VSPRVTLILAVAVVVVAAYIFAVDRPQAQRAEEATHLVQFQKGQITGISITSPKGTVVLSRVDASHWQITQPSTVPAASFTVSDLLDAILGIIPQRTMGSAGNDLAAYGLDKPVVRMTLTASGGRTVTVDLGKPSPVGTALYARLDPGTTLYLLDSGTKDTLSKSESDLRQKTLSDFANADVQRVQITSSKGSLVVVRTGPDRWRIDGPKPWPADDFKVTDLFFPLTTSDAKQFHDGVTDLAPYGLDHPAVTVDLTLKNRAEPLRVLLAPKGKVTYGMIAGAHTVLELDPSVSGKMSPDPIALVSTHVLPYNPQNLTAFTWRRNGKSLELRRQGPGFTGGGLNDKDISDMFSAMNLLDADRVQVLASPLTGAPAFEVQTDGGADARYVVQFYSQANGGWTAVNQALGLQYTVGAATLDDLPKSIKAFLGMAQSRTAPGSTGTPRTVTPTSAPPTTVTPSGTPTRKP